MRCPTLSELPPPPPGKTGWPWTEESPPLPNTMPSGHPWPRVSIVTPSYNQGQFVEETIRSVLLQGYPNLEYIIIDGGSTDGSVDIIRKYEPWLAYWMSEPDRGQAQAVNKGWHRATGEVLAWLNSDDVYMPGAISQVVKAFQDHPDAIAVVGSCAMTDAERNVTGYKRAGKHGLDLNPVRILVGGSAPAQPAIFIASHVPTAIGDLNESLYYTLDWEYWLRMGMHYSQDRIVLLESVLAEWRAGEGTKTSLGAGCGERERRRVLDQIYADPDLSTDLRALDDRAYGNTYWRQAQVQFAAGRWGGAMHSLYKAHQCKSDEYNWLRLLRFLIKAAYTKIVNLFAVS